MITSKKVRKYSACIWEKICCNFKIIEVKTSAVLISSYLGRFSSPWINNSIELEITNKTVIASLLKKKSSSCILFLLLGCFNIGVLDPVVLVSSLLLVLTHFLFCSSSFSMHFEGSLILQVSVYHWTIFAPHLTFEFNIITVQTLLICTVLSTHLSVCLPVNLFWGKNYPQQWQISKILTSGPFGNKVDCK